MNTASHKNNLDFTGPEYAADAKYQRMVVRIC